MLDGIEVNNRTLARFLCQLIPTQCPFERDVKIFGKKVCGINPDGDLALVTGGPVSKNVSSGGIVRVNW